MAPSRTRTFFTQQVSKMIPQSYIIPQYSLYTEEEYNRERRNTVLR